MGLNEAMQVLLQQQEAISKPVLGGVKIRRRTAVPSNGTARPRAFVSGPVGGPDDGRRTVLQKGA